MRHYGELHDVLQPSKSHKDTMEKFAEYLIQAGIIDFYVGAHDPTYDQLIGSFNALLPICNTIDALESHCHGFLDALQRLKGHGPTAYAEKFREKWRAAAEKYGCSGNFLDKKGMLILSLFSMHNTRSRVIYNATS